jgi:hypothetical protein
MISGLVERGALPRVLVGAALASCLLMQGCSRSNTEPSPDILKAQREALEKAKGTEKVLQDAAERRDAQMESQQK